MKSRAAVTGLLLSAIVAIHHLLPGATSLNVGLQSSFMAMKMECSRRCESEYCYLPPFLRYGKYCGIMYSGCHGEEPCDGLDRCCMIHDACVDKKHNDYLNEQCNSHFLDCITRFKASGHRPFKGSTCSVNEVVDIVSLVIEAALLAGRVIHRP